MVTGVVLGVVLLSLFYFILTLVRCPLVYKFRTKILDEDSEETIRKIRNGSFKIGQKFHPRYDNLPSFEKMVNQFWVWPISKFLKDEKKGN